MFARTWNRRKSASPRCSSLLENREEQMKAEYREVISLLRKGYSIRDVAKLSGKGFTKFSPQLTRLIFCNYMMWENRNCRKRRVFVARYSE